MPFCPNCETEFKGNVSICPDCGEIVAKGTLDEFEEAELQSDIAVCLYRSSSSAATHELSDALREAGIKFKFAQVQGPADIGGDGELYSGDEIDGEFRVAEEDYEEAREIARSLFGEIEEEEL
jgi:hypothetical protein